MEYDPEGELFDQVVKESEEDTLKNEVTVKLRFYQNCLCLSYIDGEYSWRRIIWQCCAGVREGNTDEWGQCEAKT